MKNILKKIVQKVSSFNEIAKNYQEKQQKNKKIEIKTLEDKKDEVLKCPQEIELTVSSGTITKIFFIFVVFIILKNLFLELQSIIIILSFSFFLAIALAPILKKIESYKIPRPFAILILYLVFFGALGILFVQIIPIIAEQFQNIAIDLKNYFQEGNNLEAIPYLGDFLAKINLDTHELQKVFSDNLLTISDNLQGIAGSTFSVFSDIFQGVFNFIFALVLMFFILMEREQIAIFTLHLFPINKRAYVKSKFHSVQEKMSEWLKGQGILMISMGLFMYFGMKILEIFWGMKYAATIGLVAGFMELFPYIGVLITGVLAILIAINISLVLVVLITIWIAVAQFLEGNFLVPIIMEKVVGLSSVVTIIAISVGGILGGSLGGVPMAILGMIFSIPIAASIAIFVEEYVRRDELHKD